MKRFSPSISAKLFGEWYAYAQIMCPSDDLNLLLTLGVTESIISTLYYNGSDGSDEIALTAEVASVPVLNTKKDTGTALEDSRQHYLHF